jgi:hypothetical protein
LRLTEGIKQSDRKTTGDDRSNVSAPMTIAPMTSIFRLSNKQVSGIGRDSERAGSTKTLKVRVWLLPLATLLLCPLPTPALVVRDRLGLHHVLERESVSRHVRDVSNMSETCLQKGKRQLRHLVPCPGKVERPVQDFGTFRSELLELNPWPFSPSSPYVYPSERRKRVL